MGPIPIGLGAAADLFFAAKAAEGASPRTLEWCGKHARTCCLPDIVWRTKEQFDEGSGTIDPLGAALPPLLDGIDVPAYRAATAEPVRSAEEAIYHRLLSEGTARPEMILANVARWTENRIS